MPNSPRAKPNPTAAERTNDRGAMLPPVKRRKRAAVSAATAKIASAAADTHAVTNPQGDHPRMGSEDNSMPAHDDSKAAAGGEAAPAVDVDYIHDGVS